MMVALTFSLGGHWYALQFYAWVTMIQKSTPEVGFTVAVTETLSGEKPCDICQNIRAAQKQEHYPDKEVPSQISLKVKKVDTLLVTFHSFVPPGNFVRTPVLVDSSGAPRSLVQDVLVPPPQWTGVIA